MNEPTYDMTKPPAHDMGGDRNITAISSSGDYLRPGMAPRRELQPKMKLVDKMATLVAKGIKKGIKIGATVLIGENSTPVSM